jgi:DnaJ-class molecular chaperone
VKIIPGEGMFNSKKQMKGDMRVKFKIHFPEMSDEKRTQIGTLLP